MSQKRGVFKKSIFSVRLNDLLEEKNLTYDDIYNATKVLQSTLTGIISKGKPTGSENLEALAKFLNVSTDYLLGLSDVKSTDADLKAVCEYTGLSEEAVTHLHIHKLRIESEFVFGMNESERYLDFVSKVIAFYISNYYKFFLKYKEQVEEYNKTLDSVKKECENLETYTTSITDESVNCASTKEYRKMYKEFDDKFEQFENLKQKIEQSLFLTRGYQVQATEPIESEIRYSAGFYHAQAKLEQLYDYMRKVSDDFHEIDDLLFERANELEDKQTTTTK